MSRAAAAVSSRHSRRASVSHSAVVNATLLTPYWSSPSGLRPRMVSTASRITGTASP